MEFFHLLFVLMQIGNPKDYEKKIKPGPMLPDSYRDRAGQPTRTLRAFELHSVIEVIDEVVASCYLKNRKALCFSLAIFRNEMELCPAKNKALKHFSEIDVPSPCFFLNGQAPCSVPFK